MKVTVVADVTTCTMFQLAGVGKVHPVNSPTDAGPIIKELFEDYELAIIIITPDIAKAFSNLVQSRLKSRDIFPILLELPITGEIGSNLKELISAALGVDYTTLSV